MMLRFAPIVLVLLCLSCSNRPSTKNLFVQAEGTNIHFINSIKETKEFNVFKYRNFYNGGGVAAGDLNNDGLPDLFFTANQGANKLYLNKGGFVFEDISGRAGFSDKKQWSTGVVLIDINNDGWLDIYICNAGNMMEPSLRKNQLFINNHNLTFTEKAADYGLDNDGYSTQASFFDYDMDGDLDCFLVNNSPIPVNALNFANQRDTVAERWQVADFLKGGGDHLFRNDNGKFAEVTKQAGIHGGLISLGLGVTVGDINGDGWPDVYVSNDFFERDYLYINQKNGSFTDELEQRIQHTSLSSMGADIQDINNDGSPDLFTTDMLPYDDYRLKANTSFEGYDQYRLKQTRGFYNQFTQNALQVNDGKGKFYETGFYSGVAASDWSWGALMFDADNDGLSDIFVCNGIYRDVTDQDFIDFFANEVVQQMVISGKKEEVNTITDKMPSNPVMNKMFRNTGNLRFEDMTESWGFTKPAFSNGAVYADLDNDGDLDLVISNVNENALLYRNNSREQNANHFINVSVKYMSPNLFGIGTVIKVYQGAQVITREVMPSRGFQSSVDYRQTVGLGKAGADSVVITWPNGRISSITRPAVNTTLTVTYKAEEVRYAPKQSEPQFLFEKIAAPFERHTEDEYIDFYDERNIPFMLSRQGPKAAAGDVNGDGLTDIFIGGAKGQESQLYLQSSSGWIKKDVPDFKTFSFDDVTAAFFFDSDKDGDLDLFTGGGGNFAAENSGAYINQLFVNDGKGNFTLKRGALPIGNTNCGAAIPVDYDEDGNMDIFIGSRSVPQRYGEVPKSFLLHNDGAGNFKDVTNTAAPAFAGAGMITAAVWTDLNGDGKKELVIAGEWMSPVAYRYNGTTFSALTTGLENLQGWWQHILAVDIDNDGDKDLVLGNMGQNFYLQPNEKNPVKIWMKDFDQNGTVDKIFTRTVNNRDVPVFMKREITDQIPSLKKMNLKHHDYANKSIQEIFGHDIEGSKVKTVNYALSCIAYNDGKGNFSVKPLPYQLQLSSVNAMQAVDINSDGFLDIIAAGNCFGLLPQFCRIDASYGNILINDKKGNLLVSDPAVSGIDVKGETRDILSLHYKKDNCILFLQNNDLPLLYKMNTPVPTTNKIEGRK